METLIAAKYSDVEEGAVFFFETDTQKQYPKIKRGLGHYDIRDDVSNKHGDPNWDVLIRRSQQKMEYVTCPRCRVESPDLGCGVECDNCGYGPMPTKKKEKKP